MAPKAAYTPGRLTAAAHKSATAIRRDFPDLVTEHELTCEAVLEPGQELRRASEVVFRWRFRGAGHDEVANVTARCNHVCERGVPLPESWTTALKCLALLRIVDNTVEHIRNTERGLTDVACYIAGVPKPPPYEDKIGKLVPLNIDGMRVMHFLCAHVDGDVSLVHRLSLIHI